MTEEQLRLLNALRRTRAVLQDCYEWGRVPQAVANMLPEGISKECLDKIKDLILLDIGTQLAEVEAKFEAITVTGV